MAALAKEVVREIIEGNNFQNLGEVLVFLKESFRDVLQEMLEAEMDVNLRYSREDASNKMTDNSRNGSSKKKVKSEFGMLEMLSEYTSQH